jgi:hypothetical protein
LVILATGVALLASCKRQAASEADHRFATAAHKGSVVDVTRLDLRDGDLIFQESTSRQSEMVRTLTESRWTHMGVVFIEPSGAVVLEAMSPVRKTPIQRWVEKGQDGRYVVKRLRDADAKLPPAVIERMRKLGTTWVGRPYDLRFGWDDQSLYCSELAYKLFEQVSDVRIGKLERAEDMNLDDERVQRAMRSRFSGAKFDPAETVITPDSIFHDDQLVEVKPAPLGNQASNAAASGALRD